MKLFTVISIATGETLLTTTDEDLAIQGKEKWERILNVSYKIVTTDVERAKRFMRVASENPSSGPVYWPSQDPMEQG